jgi:LysR family transcriptional regulator, cyn operon transcriptional activator
MMNLAQIELRHLRYFLAVAEAAHFTRAAERLHVTQPTLSHQIRQLEGQLNLALFDRVGGRVRLTAAGELLAPYARRVMRELTEAHTALGELHGLRRGVLRIGIVQTVNACVIPEIVSRYGEAHPGIRVACTELSVEEIEAGVAAGRLDLGVSFLPPARAGLDGRQLYTEELVAVVAANHALAGRKQIRMRDLAAHPQALLSARFCTRQLIDESLAEAGLAADVQVEMNAVESIIQTVRRTGLISILPALAMCQRDDGVRAIKLVGPTPRRAMGLVWLRGAQPRVAAEAFGRLTAEVLAARGLTAQTAAR